MTATQKRKPLPAELIERLRATGAACIAAGCTIEEAIELCRKTVDQWIAEGRPIE